MNRKTGFFLLFCLSSILWAAPVIFAQVETAGEKVQVDSATTADHSLFPQLKKKFASGPEVTRACLECHNLAARQVQDTIHWSWTCDQGPEPGLGKARVVNNF